MLALRAGVLTVLALVAGFVAAVVLGVFFGSFAQAAGPRPGVSHGLAAAFALELAAFIGWLLAAGSRLRQTRAHLGPLAAAALVLAVGFPILVLVTADQFASEIEGSVPDLEDFWGPDFTFEDYMRFRRIYGLDDPIHIKYFKWAGSRSTTLPGAGAALTTFVLAPPLAALVVAFGSLVGLPKVSRRVGILATALGTALLPVGFIACLSFVIG